MSLSKIPRILFEDQEILVCHKPSGVPAQTNRIGTPDLVSILKNHLIKNLQWSDSIINREAKERIACEIATMAKDGPVLTENGNFIPDTRFHYIDSSLEEQVKAITGAIESELFIGYDVEIITAE